MDKSDVAGTGLNLWKILAILFVVVALGITFLALIGPSVGNIYSYSGGSI
jgi:hypothetical protein